MAAVAISLMRQPGVRPMVFSTLHPSSFYKLKRGARLEVDGIKISNDDHGATLSYMHDGNLVMDRLHRGGPPEGSGEVRDDSNNLRYWYNRPLHSWVLMHERKPTEEDDIATDTIFIRDKGTILVRRGFATGLSPWELLKGLSFVGAVVLCLIAFAIKAM